MTFDGNVEIDTVIKDGGVAESIDHKQAPDVDDAGADLEAPGTSAVRRLYIIYNYNIYISPTFPIFLPLFRLY